MITNIHTETIAAGSFTGFNYRLPGDMLKTKAILITGQKLELTVGTKKKPEILLTLVGTGTRVNTPPDKRVIPFEYNFEDGDELSVTIRSACTVSQQIAVSIITE